MTTIATAGHVDHGKSTLVRALTGTDPDRLAEEQRRGLTIDLGFASFVLPSGRIVGLVDVPGHERYLKNMLAGVGAVTTCLFVVAADEGWKPQSEEHLRIIELLGLQGGVVALTKAGLVTEDDLELTALDVGDRLSGSPLADAPVVAVDSPTGRGLGPLRAALDRLVDAVPAPVDDGRARLWIDRSFAAAGAGAVVTGTLARGWLQVGDTVEVDGTAARVRGLQHHHRAADRVGPGERVAVNLAGISHRDLRRGQAVVAPGRWHRTTTVDAALGVLGSLDHDVSRRGAYTAHLGSGEQAVRLRVLGPDVLAPGSTGPVRLHLSHAVPLLPGDRFVLRESGRDETVGGGEVLDVDPVLPASRAAPDRTVARVVAERGAVDADLLERLTGVRLEPSVGRWVVDPAVLDRKRSEWAGAIGSAGTAGVDLGRLDDLDRAVVAGLDGVTVRAGVARDATDDQAARAAHPWLAALRAAPLQGVGPDQVDEGDLQELRRAGLVVRLDGVWFARAALDDLVAALGPVVRAHPDGVTVGQVRDALGGSRKTLVPFLTWCDGQGVTRRRGDVRIAGPRAPGSTGPPRDGAEVDP